MPFPTPVSTNHHDVYPAIDPRNPDLSQAGKVVFITGGGQGIGAAFVKAFATAGAAHVILVGRTAKTLEATKAAVSASVSGPTQFHTYTMDVTDEARVEAVFSEVHRTIGPIDTVVANAGYLTGSPYAEHAVDEFRRNYEINVVGLFITSQAFLRHRTPGAGTFISLNTAGAHLPAMMPAVAYISSKAAAARVVEALQFENPDVRAFNIHPGVVKTDMARKAGMHEAANDEPEMAAGLAVYLSTPSADWLKGRFVWASWDVEELKKDWQKRAGDDQALFTVAMHGLPFDGKTTPSAFD